MKNSIFYFTSTGNSLKIAKDLAAGLPEAQVIGIPKILKQKNFVLEADTVGLVFPVYCWGLPRMVLNFVRAVTIKAKYVYAVTSYGGCPGDTLLQLAAELKKKGITLQAGFGLHFPGNYTPLYGAKPEAKQQELFAKAKLAIPSIIETIKTQKPEKLAWGPWWVSVLLRLTGFYNMFLTHVKDSDQKFLVQDTCDGCGICAKVCPADNIILKDGKPNWQHHCENCLGCLQWCPKEAIQYGKTTIDRKRYHQPEIRLKEIMAQKN
jgi:ferredoxin